MKSGIVAEFEAPDRMVAAVESIRSAGFRVYEAYSPYPIEDIAEGSHPRTPLYALVFGLLGASSAYLLQWWIHVRAYPLNVAGAPPHSAPMFVPITFETAILSAAGAVFLGLMIHLRLPQLYHPLFEVEGFERSSIDRFFLAIDSHDPAFDAERASLTLHTAGALRIVPFGRRP